jgi:ATP-binding cassette subfamily C (CFTR/MRP) protein 1
MLMPNVIVFRYMLGYLVLSMGALAFNGIIIYVMLLIIGPKTSKSLHDTLLHTVLRAPQSFFASTDTGITLNRFSQDMSMVDSKLSNYPTHLNKTAAYSLPGTLPLTGMGVCMQGFKIIAQGILLFSVQKYMLTTVPFVMMLVWIIQKVYLQTSRQLRFLDLEAKAPVYSHFLETLEGVATIRAFGWQREASAENISKLGKSLIPFYALFCIQRWLNLVLDLIVAGLAIAVLLLAVSFRGTTSGGQIGIALNVVLSFNSVLLRLAESYTQLETALGAISRLKNFNEQTTPEDKPGEDHTPDNSWPEKGEIEFRDVTASYG